METENAYVKADIIAVSAEVSGRVVEVAGARQPAGRRRRAAVPARSRRRSRSQSRARAQMDVVRTDVQSLRAEYRDTLLDATEAQERIEFLTRQLERQER